MNIHGLTVCVDYAYLLETAIARWGDGLDRLSVVTSPADTATHRLARVHGATLHVTDLFYRDGASFNKARAMQSAIEAHGIGTAGWILLFDADILPPPDWRQTVARSNPTPGTLYGATRCHEHGQPIPDRETAPGYFQLLHGNDPHARPPLLETHWAHAGNYDTRLQARWPPECRRRIKDLLLVHLGETGNWHGRSEEGRRRMSAMYQERRRRHGAWDHETINPTPTEQNP
jgi:hypothetical protein